MRGSRSCSRSTSSLRSCRFARSPSLATPCTPPQVPRDGDDTLYVLYTSGSTGQPKGVPGIHRAVARRLRWQQAAYRYGPGEVASARTPLGFVDSVAEIFAPLAFGVP